MIENERDLAVLLPKIEAADWVAIDTEADSLHAYPEKLCLIQISIPDRDALIDPLAGYDVHPLLEVLREKTLLFHGADYDLRLLYRTYKFVPQAIFDTMWAARLLGLREFGLSALVRQHLGVDLEKGPQKMNWAVRPLTDRMVAYARNDTHHLWPLAETLRSGLAEKGRAGWQAETCAKVIRECARPKVYDPDSLWRVKGSDRLSPPAMAVLRELWLWREKEAVLSNKPPYFIVSHETLVSLAGASVQGRVATELIPRHLSASRASRLVAAVDRGLKIPPARYPRPRRNGAVRLTRLQQTQFDRLKAARDARARELGLDPTVLASKADLVHLAKNGKAGAEELLPWQRQVLGIGIGETLRTEELIS